MVLSNTAIRKARDKGELIIEPFTEANLNTSSYDVSLGDAYFREHAPSAAGPEVCEHDDRIYNIYDQEHVERVWGNEPEYAKTYQELIDQGLLSPGLKNIALDDQIILIGPGETILAHTFEYIGAVTNMTTVMHARSSFGRNGIETCKCSGFGDCGYATRWTMEITSNLQNYTLPLVVGRRLAQIVFLECPDVEGTYRSKYQNYSFTEAQAHWKPQDMLPKLYLDRELVKPE